LRQTPTGRLVIDAKKIKALGSKVPLRSHPHGALVGDERLGRLTVAG
jgi:hypothetical protein